VPDSPHGLRCTTAATASTTAADVYRQLHLLVDPIAVGLASVQERMFQCRGELPLHQADARRGHLRPGGRSLRCADDDHNRLANDKHDSPSLCSLLWQHNLDNNSGALFRPVQMAMVHGRQCLEQAQRRVREWLSLPGAAIRRTGRLRGRVDWLFRDHDFHNDQQYDYDPRTRMPGSRDLGLLQRRRELSLAVAIVVV
jgi:hypothetical protein